MEAGSLKRKVTIVKEGAVPSRAARSGPWLPLVLAAACSWSLASPATGGTSYTGGLGIGYFHPRDVEIADRYKDGASFHLAGEAGWERVPMGLAIEAGYFHTQTSFLPGPFFVSGAKGELTMVPLDLTARFGLGRSAYRPHLGAGIELLWSKERFTYRLDGEPRRRDPGWRLAPGIVLTAGVTRRTAPRLQVEGFLSVVPMKRWVSRGIGYEADGAPGLDAGALGARFFWRWP